MTNMAPINQAAEDYRIANGLPVMTLIEAARQLELANNGYTFASNMNPEFIRQAERLVMRKQAFKAMLPGYDGKDAVAYLTPRAAKVYKIA